MSSDRDFRKEWDEGKYGLVHIQVIDPIGDTDGLTDSEINPNWIEDMLDEIDRLKAENDNLRGSMMQLVMSCDKHGEEIKTQSVNEFISKHDWTCQFCMEDRIKELEKERDERFTTDDIVAWMMEDDCSEEWAKQFILTVSILIWTPLKTWNMVLNKVALKVGDKDE